MTDLNQLKQAIEGMVQKPVLDEGDKQTVFEVISLLDQGKLRVASQEKDDWVTEAWLKEAVLLFFRTSSLTTMHAGPFEYYDKIPLKTNYADQKVRVVPPACARFGSFLEEGVILMPSYINIGARVGARTMVDTWATVGSCAQIGQDVHLSGGVGIGGVLEPVAARPVIVEDGCFIGSRCILVEGVRVGKEAVLAANVCLTQSTPIIDTRFEPFQVIKGFVPPRAVVVAGTQEKTIAGGKIQTACAYIIGERKESTDRKTSLNQALRQFSIST